MAISNTLNADEPVPASQSPAPLYAPFPWRAFFIGIIAVPPIVFWIEYTEIVSQGTDLTSASLFTSCVALLLLLLVVNAGLRRVFPRFALSQDEMLYVYGINAACLGITSVGMMQFLVHTLAAPNYYATPSNNWSSWMFRMRSWAAPGPDAIQDFYSGNSSFFTRSHVLEWVVPILVWSGFILVLTAMSYCAATLVRKQWVERERLSFPIVVLPMELTQNGGASPLAKNPLFWGGFALVCVLEMLATIHFTLSPSFPYIPLKCNSPGFQLDQLATTPPWNGMGYLSLGFYPMAIGLTYFMPTDLSFSCWFFFLFSKIENVAAVTFGFRDPGSSMARFPYTNEQGCGAFFGIALIALRFVWPEIKKTLKSFRPSSGVVLDDKHEPLPYRTALIGVVVGFVLLVAFGCLLGITWYVGIIFFLLFLLAILACTRIHAEAGLAWLTAPGNPGLNTMVDNYGSTHYNAQSLVGLSYFRWCDADMRNISFPYQMDAMKLMERGRINPRHLTIGIAVSTVLCLAFAWVSTLGIYYHYGASNTHLEQWRTSQGYNTFNSLQNYLAMPKPTDFPGVEWTIGGVLVTIWLSIMRTRFVWWPFHPIGYAISNTWTMDWLWCPMLVGWLVKSLAVRYGGLKTYRQLLPFFVGVVLGDYTISALLAIVSLITGTPGYKTFPI